MNCDYLKTLVIDIDNAKDNNVLVNLVYRPSHKLIENLVLFQTEQQYQIID